MEQQAGNLASIFPGGFQPLREPAPDDPYQAFLDVLAAHGLQVETLRPDTHRPVRVRTEDDDADEKSGWYRFWLDPIPHGVYGDWRLGTSEKWSARDESTLDPQTLAAVRKAHEEAAKRDREERERLQQAAAEEAAKIVAQCTPAPANHPYLKAKGIQPLTALLAGDGRLVIPIYDERMTLVSLQYIAGDGKKRFLTNGKIDGCYHLIGEPGPKILTAEGFATGASLHQATRLPVAIAFNATNLPRVARTLRGLYPSARLVLCADNDQWRTDKKNVGLQRANEAAATIPGSLVVIPRFRGEHAERKPKDFNDLAALEGLTAVRAQIEAVLQTVGIDVYPASRWADQPVPAREWLLTDWIPMKQTTALYGDGGLGKTLLAQQLATAVATDKSFLGFNVAHGPVLGVFCEDDDSELHIRQDRINTMLTTRYADLHRLHLLSRVGQENLLMAFDGKDAGTLTHFWHELAATIAKLRPILVIVDTAADTFGGNENIRPQVRQYVQGALTRLANEHHCAVLLCAHPSAAGLQSGSGAGGSTAWNNSVRSRLYLSKDPATERTILTRKKSNYAAAGEEIQMVWSDGAFVPYQSGNVLTLPKVERDAERDFLLMMRGILDQGRPVSPAPNSPHYAPAQIKKRLTQRGKKSWTLEQLEGAMERLIDRNDIHIERDERKRTVQLAFTEANKTPEK